MIHHQVVIGGVLLAVLLTGCRGPAPHRAAADRAAERHLAAAQTVALGRTEALAIVSPAETLRRRLLLEADLPHVGAASLGIHDLPASEFWQPERHLTTPDGAAPAQPEWTGRPIGLIEALQLAARNSRDFRQAKEALYIAALDLDLEANAFRGTFAGMLSGSYSYAGGDDAVEAAIGGGRLGWARTFRNGVELSSRVMVDIVKLLTQDAASSLGLALDAGIAIPLLRGAGRIVTAEPLRQAERNLMYAVYRFERFKRTFAVALAADYLSVMQERQQIRNAEENYKRLVAAARRARRLADAGRLPEFQYDQAVQDELRARTRWIAVRQQYAAKLDAFKMRLGLPPDATLELDVTELDALGAAAMTRFARDEADASGEGRVGDAAPVPPADAPVVLREPDRSLAGPLELDPERAIRLALDQRMDLRTAFDRVADAQRRVSIAADALRAELTLLGEAHIGERRSSASAAGAPDAVFAPDEGNYSGLLTFDPGLERTAERTAYRKSLIALESAVRAAQELEDTIKLAVLDTLRSLLRARENLLIQFDAVRLAEKRVHSTDLLLQAGRAAVRDVLEAEEALLNAQNALVAAMVAYRVNELSLQRDMGVLAVNAEGLWTEYTPEEPE